MKLLYWNKWSSIFNRKTHISIISRLELELRLHSVANAHTSSSLERLAVAIIINNLGIDILLGRCIKIKGVSQRGYTNYLFDVI